MGEYRWETAKLGMLWAKTVVQMIEALINLEAIQIWDAERKEMREVSGCCINGHVIQINVKRD